LHSGSSGAQPRAAASSIRTRTARRAQNRSGLCNMLVNRPYYSPDDLNQMDLHAMQLMTEYKRVCE